MSILIPSPVPIGPLKDRISTLEAEAINVLDFGAKGDGATDDTQALQAALDRAVELGGARVVVPPGTYLISEYLQIGSRTHLHLDDAATIRRNSDANAMIVNRSNGSGGYDAAQDIRITGGTWDANATEHPSPCTAIGIGHASDVLIQGVTIKDIYSWHHIELNAVQRGQIVGCRFIDFVVGSRDSEAVQLDLAINEGAWPWFGPWDNTPCREITIERCHFSGQSRGLGTHSSKTGVLHEGIIVRGCFFEDCELEGIHALNWASVQIVGNSFRDMQCGVRIISRSDTEARNFIVADNLFEDMGKGDTGPDARAIRFFGGGSSQNQVRNLKGISVTGNTVHRSGRHGITFDYCSEISVSGNVVVDAGFSQEAEAGFGIAVFASDHAVVSGNRIEQANEAGIIFYWCKSSLAAGNQIMGNGASGAGVSIRRPSADCLVQGNRIDGVGIGVWLDSDIEAPHLVADNFITGCDDTGIKCEQPTLTQGMIRGNIIRDCGEFGIVVRGSDNWVVGNDLRGAAPTPLEDLGTDTITEGNLS